MTPNNLDIFNSKTDDVLDNVQQFLDACASHNINGREIATAYDHFRNLTLNDLSPLMDNEENEYGFKTSKTQTLILRYGKLTLQLDAWWLDNTEVDFDYLTVKFF